jgi:hypothetical protein
MPAHCETCIHWNATRNQGLRAEGAVGTCRAAQPIKDFTWPRTKANDTCGKYAASVSFATPPFTPPLPPGTVIYQKRGESPQEAIARTQAETQPAPTPEQPPAAEAAQLTLDAGSNGDAPPAGASASGPGNRQRARGR